MADLVLNLDTKELDELARDFESFEAEMNRSAQLLAGQTHLHILEQVQQRLHSRREMYVKALAKPTEVQPGVFMITLKEEGVWIEEGMPPHSMVKDLLGDNPKVAADGSRYRVIPFEHSKGGPTSNTPAEQELVSAIKSELKKMRIPWKGVERNQDGSPKTGLLHKLDIMDKPIRPRGALPDHNLTQDPTKPDNQHGFGQGSPGKVMVGPTGIPFLKGLQIRQSGLFNADGTPRLDAKGRQMATRSISTFRVVSSKHEGERWNYPGIEGVKFMDEAVEWAAREWDQKILPDLLKKLGAE